MAERYLHFEVTLDQRSKHGQQVCGDAASVMRTESETAVMVCDGVGSGTAAHVAAQMCRARLEQLLAGGFSLREAFLCISSSMEQWKQPGKPYAAFTIAQIRGDGHAQIMGYESPAAVWVTPGQAQTLPMHRFMHDSVSGWEANCYLRTGEGLLLVTDGITQSGMDTLSGGWQSEGMAEYVNSLLYKHTADNLAEQVQHKAADLNNRICHDDATVAWIVCRSACPMSLLIGPPAEKLMDMAVVERFMAMPGAKVVCGATTSTIVARVLGGEMRMEEEPMSLITPPRYYLEGIDLITEGAVTLNQLNNVLELDPVNFDEVSAVTELYDLLTAADRIHIFTGTGKNTAHEDVCFVQQGVLSREKIIPMIARKLRKQGKCVIIEPV
ncbi:MAG: SpoIIE family protein phosphatase [Phycisphaerae bacterium]|nr:SpoIIE family protein phosphatase [Phycisphaerae bacterium]